MSALQSNILWKYVLFSTGRVTEYPNIPAVSGLSSLEWFLERKAAKLGFDGPPPYPSSEGVWKFKNSNSTRQLVLATPPTQKKRS